MCGFKAACLIGLSSHKRSCTVSKRLAVGELGQSRTDTSQSVTLSVNTESRLTVGARLLTRGLTVGARLSGLTGPVLDDGSAVHNNNNKLDANNIFLTDNISNQQTNFNIDVPFELIETRSNSGQDKRIDRNSLTKDINTNVTNVDNIKGPSHCVYDQIKPDRISSTSLRPLQGVSLPKSEKAWEEMGHYFHAHPLFRFAVGKIGDLDAAAMEFNQSIYGYLKEKYGTLKGSEKAVIRGDSAFDIKYRDWSRSRIRRALSKLKCRRPVIEGSSLCDEILYLSHRLRHEMSSRPQAARPVTDKDFGIGVWATCQKIFLDVVASLPTFNILECGAYFLKVLSVPDSLRLCLFQIPQWFVSLPPPATPFDLSAPSYAEIASNIKKARAGSSACPLDQISVISLKKCPILRTILHNIIANCWQSQYTPKAWRVGVTILIYKKGDPSKVDNFRPITLQSVPYKIFSSFVRNRLQAYLDSNKYHNNNIQKGFAHGQDGVLEHTELLDFMMRDAKKSH